MNEIIIYRDFPIIKNPTEKDYKFIKARFKELLPFAPAGEPYCRTTYDNKGNTYIWCSVDATHWSVEGYLKNKYNTKCNQNKYMLEAN